MFKLMLLSILLVTSISHCSEVVYGFDSNVPLKYKKAVREVMQSMPGVACTEMRKAVKFNTPGILRFSWVNGAFNTPVQPAAATLNQQTTGDVMQNGRLMAWIYYGNNTTISLTGDQYWSRGALLQTLRREIRLATGN